MNSDHLSEEIGVIRRREVEARIVGPLVEGFSARFGREETLEVVREVIENLARQVGRDLRDNVSNGDLTSFAAGWEPWTRGGSLEIEELERTAEAWSFNVTRCRYAELYQDLGLPELGATLSCNRDAALVEGFSDAIKLERTQTIMQGAKFCDFRYRRRPETHAD